MTQDNISPEEHAAEKYAKMGYNILWILPKGAKYFRYSYGAARLDTADGKSAEGVGKWKEWETVKQGPNYAGTFREILQNLNKRLGQHLTVEEMKIHRITSLNLALVCGDVSGNEEYGAGVIDIDGKGKQLWDESLLLLESKDEVLAQKMRETPETQTPSGGGHVHFWYRKKDFEYQLKSMSVYSGSGKHEEIKILANGHYVLEAPSAGYVGIKEDFEKIAKLSKKEFEMLVGSIRTVCREQQPPDQEMKKTSWIYAAELEPKTPVSVYLSPISVLTEIGQRLYQEPTRHKFVLRFGSYLRRYLAMNKEDVHEVIGSLAPDDEKNLKTVEDIFRKPIDLVANRLTLRDLIQEITKDERTTANIMRELMNFEPKSEIRDIEEGEEDEEQKPSARLLDLAIENTELCFKDQNDNYHAVIRNTDTVDIISLDSDEFDQTLSGLYRKDTNGKELARKDWKSQVIENLKNIVDERARVDPKFKKTLYDRSIWIGDTYYYNLNNSKGKIVKVTRNEVSIVRQNPELILFKKLPEDREQVNPDFDLEADKNDNVRDYLKEFLNKFNFEDNEEGTHVMILQCYIPTLFLNAAAIPIHVATGDEGSTKTTFQRQIKSLVDPTENKNGNRIEDKILGLTIELDIDPDHMWERSLTIDQNHFTCFDNVDHIPKNVFDELCVAVTGYKVPKRILYKTDKMMYLIGRRPLAITSVLFTAPKPDYLDRVIHTKLIASGKYRTEQQVWHEYYEIKAKILGFIFTKIKEFLAEYDKLKGLIIPRTRLADFEIQCEIMSRCLGNEPNMFQDAWVEKKGQQIEDSLENNSLYILLKKYLIKHRNEVINNLSGKQYGTEPKYVIENRQSQDHYTQILLDTVYNNMFISEDDRSGWWKSLHSFSQELKKLRGQLSKVGITIRDGGKVKNKRIKIIDYTKWTQDKDEDFWKLDEDAMRK